ncbi:MAG: hypothetical protein U5K75_04785 [Ahrensia sp.]|nr:hypothetical protein [Ahrensia sp.]
MVFLNHNIKIIWWLTGFATTCLSWLFVTKLDFGGVIQRVFEPFLDIIFYISVGLSAIALFIAALSAVVKHPASTKFLVRSWFVYVGVFLLFCAGSAYFLSMLTFTII